MQRSLKAVVVGMVMAVCAVLGVAVDTPQAAAALRGCRTEGAYEVCFTDPVATGGNDDPTIVNRLQALIRSADSDDMVLIAMYAWDLTGIADEVVAAKTEGVNIQVVIDGGKSQGTTAFTKLRNGLGSYFHPCPAATACISNSESGINHNKFFLFRIDGVESVVQTSTNLTGAMLRRQNNMVKVTGDANLFDFYYKYWHRLRANSWTYSDGGGTWTDADKRADGSLGTVGYAFPRGDGDPIPAILNNVTDCTGSRQGRIWVSQSKISQTDRSDLFLQRLDELETMGCDVKIVVYDDDPAAGELSMVDWVERDAPTHNLRNENVKKAQVHHKFILIDAAYNGEWARYVFTGSHNITVSSLRYNDEAMMRIRNPFVFEQFEQHFGGLFAQATG